MLELLRHAMELGLFGPQATGRVFSWRQVKPRAVSETSDGLRSERAAGVSVCKLYIKGECSTVVYLFILSVYRIHLWRLCCCTAYL